MTATVKSPWTVRVLDKGTVSLGLRVCVGTFPAVHHDMDVAFRSLWLWLQSRLSLWLWLKL